MGFRGLFIGIDRYASPNINWLSCAQRDAVALHSLFTDTLGGETTLITDDGATRAALEEHFGRLANCNKDDVVVISFSGHGTETHELVTYDADTHDLEKTCIPLTELNTWLTRIPARRLLLILDCCFSGGMGSRVLQVDTIPRDLASTENLLDQLSGDGRLILTASTATQPAWENSRLKHGLLTYHLVEALQGAEEVRQAGKISIYRLLEYVTQRVTDAAARLGKPQYPTFRGELDGELTWPIFTPGALYRAAFPERSRPQITADIGSLSAYGFPPDLITAWAGSIPSLNQLQLDAINEFNLLEGEHLVVSAPTSSGKTMIGELAVLKGALERKRSFFLLPLKALVYDKYVYFNRLYGAFGLRTIRATGETNADLPALMRGRYDVCLLTYEKFAALVLGNPHLLEQVGTVVVDEVQMIADRSRGINLEFILTLLRMRRRQGIEPQLIALSAVIGDTNGLEHWLGARLLRRNERPVPLDEGVLRRDGSFRFISPEGEEKIVGPIIRPEWSGKQSSQDWVIPLVRKLVREGKQVIVFREIKGEARGCALYLARELGLPPAQTALDALPMGDPSNASVDLRSALKGGVAFHTADHDREERLIIEEQFRALDTTLRVLVATTTLAMGVNTPASAVVVVGLEHPDKQPYSVAEYKNMVGRAGRSGFTEHGTSYLLAPTAKEENYVWTRYVTGQPEDIKSRFLADNADLRSLVVRVLVTAQQSIKSVSQGLRAEEIIGFLEASFGAFQQMQTSQNWKWSRENIAKALSNLQGHGLVELNEDGRYHLSPLGRLAGEMGIEIESITRIVETLTPLSSDQISDPTLITAAQLTVEMDNVIFPINKKSTQKEPELWPSELRHQAVPESVMKALHRSVSDHYQATLRAKKAVSCLLWITASPIAEIERVLTQFGGAFGGAAGPIRSVASRTCDVLDAVVKVAETLHPGLDISERSARLLTRLEVGVPAKAVDLAAKLGTRLTRSDYQSLLKADLISIQAIESSSDESLLNCLGQDKEKLSEVRRAVKAHLESERNQAPIIPILAPYEG